MGGNPWILEISSYFNCLAYRYAPGPSPYTSPSSKINKESFLVSGQEKLMLLHTHTHFSVCNCMTLYTIRTVYRISVLLIKMYMHTENGDKKKSISSSPVLSLPLQHIPTQKPSHPKCACWFAYLPLLDSGTSPSETESWPFDLCLPSAWHGAWEMIGIL